MRIGVGRYEFWDLRNHCPPNWNLDKFAKCWGVRDIQKELFPYEWLDSIDKLQHTLLPPREAFYSKLKNSTPTQAEYESLMLYAYGKKENSKHLKNICCSIVKEMLIL